MYDKLTNDMTSLRRQLRKNPSSTFLKEDYNEVVKERKEVKRKMDELFKKIN
ncbi:unnamed protein product [marine sediment metagenome]|uniref:Uncharacterized protein n=1 Tax=marine sediment metagenome TaxID=412755 RepID=X1BRT9_9ZZZZ